MILSTSCIKSAYFRNFRPMDSGFSSSFILHFSINALRSSCAVPLQSASISINLRNALIIGSLVYSFTSRFFACISALPSQVH